MALFYEKFFVNFSGFGNITNLSINGHRVHSLLELGGREPLVICVTCTETWQLSHDRRHDAKLKGQGD